MEIKVPELSNSKREKNEQPWLLSYSDMVTLLLAFFVLFFAISQVDQVKFEMIMEYFSKNETMPLHVLEERFKELIQAHNLEEQVDVELTPDGLLVNFQDNILFDSGKADLKNKAFPILGSLAEILNEQDVGHRKVRVEGHTDTVPIAKTAAYPSNWELSTARSASVIRFLIDRKISSDKFVAVGFADTRLRIPETTEQRGISENRRVSLLIK
jgi:chemotaxis protein MotB